ncbi:MAG: 50S ribosomal protein L25/general stress protein Ctc [Flavobacteriaceae bacterium]|nr:50S ribosomal protein L25/general stress protein Ctc [Flavobacteriaceae bacterium]MCY4217447.1 50S ribosomal protein L25/general stress protein Ctc [Flavobacteriaceae bacterium]MCY4254239.1 50S ribosomal protein L25/general stress protein Ctc [Flavobacteriaceae bacterium]
MQALTINATLREQVGKVATKAIRKAKRVPCVLYGGDTPIHFSVPENDFKELIYTPRAYIVELIIDKKQTYKAILQDIQFHPVTDAILHVDFLQLFDEKPVVIEVPVRIKGVPIGVLSQGGVLRVNRQKIALRALPKNLPDFLECDVTPLRIGNKFYVTELKNPDFEILESENVVVAQVRTSRTALKTSPEATEESTEAKEGS